jgi:hypothetical protein
MDIPYLGGPEDRIFAAFHDSYSSAAHVWRTMASRVFALDDPLAVAHTAMDGDALKFYEALVPELELAHRTGAARGRKQVAAVHDWTWPTATIKAAMPAYSDPIYPIRELHLPRWPSSIRIPPVPRAHRTFGHAPLSHIDAARDLALNLVTQVDQTQRDTIAAMITEAITRGFDADLTGLRIANVVGLFPRWQRAVDNLFTNMLSNDVPLRIAQKRADDYADSLREKRGRMIARTELLRAMNSGRQAGWQSMADKGQLDPERSIKEWVSASVGACEECDYLGDVQGSGHGYRVRGIDGLFPTEWGPIPHPPAHPHCRCACILHPVFVSLERDSDQEAMDDADLNNPEMAQILHLV